MSERYNHKAIETKWQDHWDATQIYRSVVDWSKPKHYALTMLPYPSGDLHIGHWFAMTPSDARARYMRMKGYNVLFPMGFDAFGLPAENAAVQRGIHPAGWTFGNIERMRGQLRSMGAMFDWEREMVSCEPGYYHWTQWFFKRFYENGLAFRGEALVNWSETLQTVLANEQVIDGKDERTGQPVIQKMMTQWFFRYTRYADEMLDFSKLDWPEPVKIMQTNWIGRSEGARVYFHSEAGDVIEIYTTRPDTLWGATFMVLAPEHPLVKKLTTDAQRADVEAYVAEAARATEIQRTSEEREKTGVFTGGYAINPVNAERIPIWIADYVMITYGTGAIMAVPAHDGRDFAFASKFGIEIRPVIQPEGVSYAVTPMTEPYTGAGVVINSDWLNGQMSNGQKGRKNPAINAVIDRLASDNIGAEAINYRLRDWLISRQRYWGCPIPMIFDADGNIYTVPDSDLPVELPVNVEFKASGPSPLATSDDFLRTTTPDGRPARRETDTMDTFMCSSWYQLRYLSPKYDQAPFDPEEAAYWLPVDVYTGGAEHATMHLLYTRWFNKAIRDLGVYDDAMQIMREHGRDPHGLFDEPMLLLRNQGQVLGGEREGDWIIATGRQEGEKLYADYVKVIASPSEIPAGFDGVAGEIMRRTENLLVVNMAGINRTVEVVKGAVVEIPNIPGDNDVTQLKQHLEVMRMSKSRGNVVNPDELVDQFGADTVRAYLMFAFDWQKGGPWDPNGVTGVVRWINDIWNLVTGGASNGNDAEADRELERKVHQTIDGVSYGLENFSFNAAIARLMELRNELKAVSAAGKVSRAAWDEAVRALLLLMAPFTPHVAEELWSQTGGGYSIHQQGWPVYDAEKAAEAMIDLVVMVNGKVRDTIKVAAEITEQQAIEKALASESVQRMLDGGEPKRVVYVAGRKGQEPKVNIVA